MDQQENKIVLASASPRRYDILRETGLTFSVISADVDEYIPKELEPKIAVQFLAAKKASAVAERAGDAIIIGADTIVVADGDILGKPQSPEDAKRMLQMLSGNTHKVMTGVSVIRSTDGKMFSFAEITEVEFHPLLEKEIDDYVASGEPMDKAGAYGIQGLGGKLVKDVRGDFLNVVGLPKTALIKVLKKEFGVKFYE